MNTVVIIDGQHYSEVIKTTLQHLTSAKGYHLMAAVFIEGGNRADKTELSDVLNLPVIVEPDPFSGLIKALNSYPLDIVVDLSGEPFLGYQDRLNFARLITGRGVIYEGAGFTFKPPQREDVMEKPSLAIIGTGKRVGKTTFSAYSARVLPERFNPCIITMGRGGAVIPEIIRGDQQKIYLKELIKMTKSGRHVTSDYLEDAVTAGVTTIGSQRCGGGFAGSVYYSNVVESALLANRLDNNLVLFEGSGAAVPPVRIDAAVLMVAGHQSPAYLEEYIGRYHFLTADLIILTFCEKPLFNPENAARLRDFIRGINPRVRIVETIFRPEPLVDLTGKNVYYLTTAPASMGGILSKELEDKFDCKVLGLSHNLSNPEEAAKDLRGISGSRPKIDCILTEMKANSIGLILKTAVRNNLEIALCNYIPICKDPAENLSGIISETAAVAVERFNKRQA